MSFRLLMTSVVIAGLVAPDAVLAQDALEDDLLAPLTPGDTKQPKKKKRAPKEENPLDDLVAPLKAPTELIVTMSESISGAKLFIDGKEIGDVNGAPVEVAPGEHRLLVKRIGFADFLGTVNVPDGGRESVTVSMFPSGGVLAIQPNVPAADVFVDGKLIGKGPIKDLVLKPGSYEIRVAKAGYSAEVSRLSIRAGKDYTLTPLLTPELAPDRPEKPNLEPVASANTTNVAATQIKTTPQLAAAPTPWYGQWYVWAGAAAVVAAAAGGTFVAVNTGPPAFTDEEVCGGNCDVVLNGVRASRRTVMFAPKLAF